MLAFFKSYVYKTNYCSSSGTCAFGARRLRQARYMKSHNVVRALKHYSLNNNRMKLFNHNIPARILLLILLLLSFYGCSRERFIETVNLTTKIRYNNLNSSIIKSLNSDCDNCSYFETTEKYKETINQPNYIFIAHSKKEFSNEVKSFIESDYLKSIPDEFFNNNILGVALISYTGLRYLKNERIINENGFYTFVVDIWEHKAEAIPACAYKAIYIFKIQK